MAEKTLRYSRHAPKDKNGFVNEKGLLFARDHSPAVGCGIICTDIFYGEIFRTCQTALTVVSTMIYQPKIHPPIKEIGDDVLFKELMGNPEIMKRYKAGETALEAVKATLSKDEFSNLAAYAFSAVQKMFSLISFNHYGLAYGHDPLIQLAVIGAGFGNLAKNVIKPMGSYTFCMDDDGKITVVS